MAETVPAPADLWALAARAEELARDLAAAEAGLRTAVDEPTRRVGFRLDDDAGWVRQAARDIEQTAEDLARIRSRGAMSRPRCRAEWGVCPEHGNTLTSSGGHSWCKTSGCGRRWDWDRGGLPCTEPVAFRVRDQAGKVIELCAGHTIAARAQLEGAEVVPIEEDQT
jgi:hypothetical protein